MNEIHFIQLGFSSKSSMFFFFLNCIAILDGICIELWDRNLRDEHGINQLNLMSIKPNRCQELVEYILY